MRLDNTKRSDVRRVNDVDFLNTLNIVKPIILTNKRKEPDPNKINIGDLVCGCCRGYAKKFKPDTVQLSSNQASTSRLYPDIQYTSQNTLFEASSSIASSSQPSSSHLNILYLSYLVCKTCKTL